MPGNNSATHFGWTVTFTDSDHSYRDQVGTLYASCTSLVSAFFPRFDTDYHAARVAAREGRSIDQVKATWEAKAKAACDYGSRVHEHAENLILGRPRSMPVTEKEKTAFIAVDRALVGIKKHFEILGCEQIVFSPWNHLAGTIDLPVRHKVTRRLGILDWKTNEVLDLTPRFPQTALPPIDHIADCNGNHYRLQFAIYAQIMRVGDYVSPDEPFDNAAIYIPPMSKDPAWIPMPDAQIEADKMIQCWDVAFMNQELPAPIFLENIKKGVANA